MTRSLDAAAALIERDYRRALTVEHLAKAAGLSRFHFIRAFTARYGMTPHQRLRARRLERACELLITTPMPITDICEAVGFASLGTFSRTFHAATGESPTTFRKKRRKSVRIPSCFVRMYRAG